MKPKPVKRRKKCDYCNWDNCPVRFGFEIYFQGEEDEKSARKKLYPLIKKLFDSGDRIMKRYRNL